VEVLVNDFRAVNIDAALIAAAARRFVSDDGRARLRNRPDRRTAADQCRSACKIARSASATTTEACRPAALSHLM
jgi:hypothetical protein